MVAEDIEKLKAEQVGLIWLMKSKEYTKVLPI